MMDVQSLRSLSIVEYLEYKGTKFIDGYGYKKCSSPFSRDSNPSFIVYDTNYFVCFSTGRRGDIITLVQELNNVGFVEALTLLELYKDTTGAKTYVPDLVRIERIKRKKEEGFNLEAYINKNKEEIRIIKDYASSRGISSGYLPGVTFIMGEERGEWERVPAILFPHKDVELKTTGAKFRNIYPKDGVRFTSRGILSWYVLSNLVDSHREPTLFIMESETSANSLWEYCKKINKPAVILSFGGISAITPEIPSAYENIKDRRVIIDYDGDEEMFKVRLKRWEGYGTPVRMILDKGEDINSLWNSGRIDVIYDLIK